MKVLQKGPLSWIGRHELATLVLLAMVAGGIWGFVELADEVLEKETRSIDSTLLLMLRNPDDASDPLGPLWFEEGVRDITSLGSAGILVFINVAVAGYLLLQRRYRTTLLVVAAVGGGQVLSYALKVLIDRPRPDLVPHGMHVITASFPSGHSMMAAVTYLTLGALLAKMQSRLRIKAYLLSLAVLLSFMVGLSRVYLGVHWPTDVLAGWTAGASWALLCWLLARWLQRRGQIEPEE